MKLGILFAGQGSQKVGMGNDFYEQSETFRKVFSLLPEEQRNIAFEGPQDALKETNNTQPILLAFALGVYRMLEEEGVRPAVAAGLSLGEYSALGAAGVWEDETALELIQFRAREMTKVSEGIQTVMSAVIGAKREAVLETVDEVAKKGEGYHVEVANFNCPGQIVLSGQALGVEEAETLLKERGAKRCMRLPVSGPFHTSYMKPAGDALREKFKTVEFNEPAFPVYFNTLGGENSENREIPELLAEQVSHSVYMEDIIRSMVESGVDTILEIGPGNTLSNFVRKTDRSIETMNIDTWEDFQKVVERIENHG